MTSVAVAGRADLTDAQWARLVPLLPRPKKAGRPPMWTKRQLIDGIRWRTRVGCPWRDVPPQYGSWSAVYGLFRRWQRGGVWWLIVKMLQVFADATGSIGWQVSVDSTIMRAHQHAAGARRDGAAQAEPPGGDGELEPADHGLGRSRGGWTTKLHLACEQGCRVLSLLVTPGQAADSPQFTTKSRSPRSVVGGRGYGRSEYWPTKRIPVARTGRGCAGMGSGRRARFQRIRPPIAVIVVRAAVGLRRSTRLSIVTAMRSNGVSTSSNNIVPWPPDTTSSPSGTRPPSTSL
ncbi:Transposase and inactivated derivatives [Nocardia farcinica]|uniref:Transposase and inactivated derivatives n=1 Tax=Nocardia farcinica TaxID=37329 RepID=A0A449GFB9_NOCFR|nr:Transposase and inactivated derivatives [Nocardia farcinica]